MTAEIIYIADYRRTRVAVTVSGDLAAWFWSWVCFWTGMAPRQRPVGEVRRLRVGAR